MSIGWAILSTGNYPDTSVAPAIKHAEGARLVAVYSRERARGEAFAEKHGAQAVYASTGNLLKDSRVDALYITSPNHLHAPYATMAANAGKHVLVEKPLSVSVAEGVEMVRTCQARGAKLGVGFQLRQHPGPSKQRTSSLMGPWGLSLSPRRSWGAASGVRCGPRLAPASESGGRTRT